MLIFETYENQNKIYYEFTISTIVKQLILFSVYITFTNHGYRQIMGESLNFPPNSGPYVELSGASDFGKSSNFDHEFTFEAWI